MLAAAAAPRSGVEGKAEEKYIYTHNGFGFRERIKVESTKKCKVKIYRLKRFTYGS